jgi:hypothetical protein
MSFQEKQMATSTLQCLIEPHTKEKKSKIVLKSSEIDDDDDDDGDEPSKSFDIPQKYTKSGRKRAVPFPLKVGIIKCHYYVVQNRALLKPNFT